MPADDNKPKRPPRGPDIQRPEDPTIRAHRIAERPDDGEAFLPDPTMPGVQGPVTDAESFGEEFVASATTGEPLHMDALDEVTEEEEGGPFLELDQDEEIPEAKGPEVPAPRRREGPRRSLPR